MADHDDDVVVVAASFMYFLMKRMLMLDYITVFWCKCTSIHTSVKCRNYLFLLL